VNQKALMILGMHRSGTSAVTRVLNLVGVHIGNNLMQPAEDNITGFWEHPEIVAVHERLLQAIHHNWSDILPFPEKWWLDDKTQPFRREIVGILKRDFGEYGLWGLKDPRLCRLLPLWHSILSELGCEEYFVVIFRNPVEVAASLSKRNGFTIYKSALLWFRHVSEAEGYTRGYPRAFVEYSQLLKDWEGVVDNISRRTRISLQKEIPSVRQEIADFLSFSLRHHKESYERLAERHDVPSFVTGTYRELVKASLDDGYDLTECLSRYKIEFEERLSAFSPVIAVLEEVGISNEERTAWARLVSERDSQLGELRAQVSEREAVIAQRDGQVLELQAQVSEWEVVIAQRDGHIKDLEGHGGELEKAVASLNERIFRLSLENDQLHTKVQVYENSKSWRLTAPLRSARRVCIECYRTCVRAFYLGLRLLWRHIPLSMGKRARIKSAIFSSFGVQPDWPVAQEWEIFPPAIFETSRSAMEPLARQLDFPSCAKPLVSVIIPVFNRVEYTVSCLTSIQKYSAQCSHEIIVVDDGSTDDTQRILSGVQNLQYFRNEKNFGYLRSCNRGASLAKGKYLMFLNNDTQVLPGWLDELVKVFATLKDAGAAGSKLIYPNGYLQAAGLALKKDGTVKMIGLDAAPDQPQYNSMREVDHCSGASLIVDREVFERLGGFDERYAPAYYEDADLSMRVRELGKKIIYQPASVVVHHSSVQANGAKDEKARQIEINKRKFLDRWRSKVCELDGARLIAFYLPQYHPIPENDEWWGKGFTEWTNVTRAKPIFDGHYQPRIPGELGFYDLRAPEVRERQAELARQCGIYGFCYYYYWFSGKRLLYRPLEEVLQSGKPLFPFCICWANENWTRRWDGLESEILIEQRYSDEDSLNFIKALESALRDKRYIRINGRPLLLVYRAGRLPEPKRTSDIWREYCQHVGIGEIYLASVQSFGALDSPSDLGFDAAVEFPPQAFAVETDLPSNILNPKFSGRFYDYVATAARFMSRMLPSYTLFRTVVPNWDNSARRPEAGDIFLNAGPEHYEKWLRWAIEETRDFKFGEERLVFINAWNEWAEGNYLEPDSKYGVQYLEATERALGDLVTMDRS
jgi:GT2 family glycosyltransferase